MARHVAMLRGINVGGRARVAMADLRAVFGDLGHGDVRTYVQSGNVVFSSRSAAATLAPSIQRAVSEAFAMDIKVLVRSHGELASVLARNPLAGGGRADAHLHVTFLATTPGAARVRGVDPGAYAPDELAVVGRHVYLHCPDGYGRSKLSNAFFERALGTVATTRNLRTVTELARLST